MILGCRHDYSGVVIQQYLITEFFTLRSPVNPNKQASNRDGHLHAATLS